MTGIELFIKTLQHWGVPYISTLCGYGLDPLDDACHKNSLRLVDVRNEQGAQDALAIIDQSLTEVATVRGELGAFQKHTLESNLTSLQVAAENMTAAESTIRDTDMAQELATFTRNQIMTQSATAQLAQANAMPQHVLRLLNG